MAAGELAERHGMSLRAEDVSKVPRTLEDGATSRESVRLEDAGIEIETHWLARSPDVFRNEPTALRRGIKVWADDAIRCPREVA